MNKLRRRLRSRGGFTLGELLAAMVILLISTGVIVQTLSLAFGQYRARTLAGEAGVLCDTISLAVQDKLGRGTAATPFDGDAKDFVALSGAAYGSRGLTAHLVVAPDGEGCDVTLTIRDSGGVPLAENEFTVYPALVSAGG